MYRSVGHSSDSQRQRRRSFHQNDTTRVNSQVFDMRTILKEGPSTPTDLHSSKSDGMVHVEKDKESKDKDKRKQHLSKTSNRSSLYVPL